ncbi:hypothetical protein B0H10DRAFT_1960317 [Mycena sp. CBHHK59/15]|nr:hypothetical protein B0H10DRAFT_1960317 [Mycena sp. CBHHK59/15]
MIQCFQSSYKAKGTCKKTMVICFRAANACPKVYVSALVSANFGLRLVETAVTHSSKPTIFSLALPDSSTLKHLIDDRPLYVDIECVHLTTDNIACRHHCPMSRFVSAEDTAFTFLSHYVPVTAVPRVFFLAHHLLSRFSLTLFYLQPTPPKTSVGSLHEDLLFGVGSGCAIRLHGLLGSVKVDKDESDSNTREDFGIIVVIEVVGPIVNAERSEDTDVTLELGMSDALSGKTVERKNIDDGGSGPNKRVYPLYEASGSPLPCSGSSLM